MTIAEIDRPPVKPSTVGLSNDSINSSSTIPEISARLTLHQRETAGVVFHAFLIRQAIDHVHNPIPALRRRNMERLLTAYDSLQADEVTSWTPQAQKIADKLGGTKEEIYTRAEEWHTPVQLRHVTLQAVKEVRELGDVYLTLLYERSSLAADQVDKLKSEIPSWKESIKVLSEGQKITAEAVCARLLLQKCRDTAKKDKKDNPSSRTDREQDVVRLLKAHIRIQQGNHGKTSQEEWDDVRARDMLPDLEKGRDKIFEKAQYWGEQDQRRKVTAAARDFKKVEKNVLHDLTGITQEQIGEAKEGRLSEWIATTTLAIGNEMFSHAPGVAVITPAVNLHEHLPHNPWVLGVATAILYGGMAGVLVRNAFLNVDLLKTGISLDPWSKAKYDKATDNEKKEAIKGSLQYHLLWEVPFIATAVVIASRSGWDVALAYFNAATIAGLTKNTLLNGALETYHWLQTATKRKTGKEST